MEKIEQLDRVLTRSFGMHLWKRVRNGCSTFDFARVQSILLRDVNVLATEKNCLFCRVKQGQ